MGLSLIRLHWNNLWRSDGTDILLWHSSLSVELGAFKSASLLAVGGVYS